MGQLAQLSSVHETVTISLDVILFLDVISRLLLTVPHDRTLGRF